VISTLTRVAVVVTLAWGVFAFGATYLWASQPLMIACVVAAGFAWLASRQSSQPIVLLAPIVIVCAAIGAQLVPLPQAALLFVSPNTPAVLAQIYLLYALQSGAHALSIAPAATWHALALFMAFAALLVALTRWLSLEGTRWLLWAVAVMGLVLALFGVGQKALGDGIRIYGFWTPIMPGTPFGPFVNRNHFAGWVLMAIPLTLGLVCAGIARGLSRRRPTWRERLLWLGSVDGSRVMLAATCLVAMALALVMTLSRSGMAALAIALTLSGAAILRGVRGADRRSFIWLLALSVGFLVVAWVGVDVVANRFAGTSWTEFDQRRGAWSDALDIASRFVATGTGLNTYGTATLIFQRHDLAQHYAQAHNDYLQLWAEGGLLLTIPAVVFVRALVAGIASRFREDERYSTAWWARTGAATGMLAIALQEAFDFSLQMPGNGVLFVVLCAIALHKPLRPAARSVART